MADHPRELPPDETSGLLARIPMMLRIHGDTPPPAATPGVVSPSLVETEPLDPAPGPSEPADAESTAGEDRRDLAGARAQGSHAFAAFAQIYDRHAPVVLAVCRRFTGDRHADIAEAEDAMQETFMRAHRMLDRLEAPAALRSWLLGIARRVCSERRRTTSRRIRHEQAAHSTIARTRRNQDEHGAEVVVESAAREESLRRLDAALGALSDDERLAIHLQYMDPDPVHAAEAALGLSRSAFYKLVARARERLARLMREESIS